MDERNEITTSAARDYLKDIIGFSDIELDSLDAEGTDLSVDIIAQVASNIANDGYEPEEVKKLIKEQFPEVFNFKRPVCAADVEEEEHRYLWKPYIPLEDYSVIMAAGGTGKTFVTCWLSAQVTKGGFLPADTDFYAQEEARRTGSKPEPGNVLYISSEEESSELKRRLRESGGDVSRFYIYDRKDSIGMNFTSGFSDFMMRVNSCKPKLVIIDPWQTFIGTDIDINRQNQMRPALQKLALLGKNCGCAIVLISHLNKKRQEENVNNAAMGSSELINAARSALMVIMDEEDEDPDGRILVHTKSNYAPLGDSLKFHITPNSGFIYDGISMVTRSILEEAARIRKTVAETMEKRKGDREAREKLIEAVRDAAKPIPPGASTIKAFEEMQDYYGEDVFSGAKRPGLLLKKCRMKLDEYGIEIRLTTDSGNPKKVTYNDKTRNGFEIYKKF